MLPCLGFPYPLSLYISSGKSAYKKQTTIAPSTQRLFCTIYIKASGHRKIPKQAALAPLLHLAFMVKAMSPNMYLRKPTNHQTDFLFPVFDISHPRPYTSILPPSLLPRTAACIHSAIDQTSHENPTATATNTNTHNVPSFSSCKHYMR